MRWWPVALQLWRWLENELPSRIYQQREVIQAAMASCAISYRVVCAGLTKHRTICYSSEFVRSLPLL